MAGFGSEPEEALGVSVENFPLGRLVRDQPADLLELPEPGATRGDRGCIVAVAAVHELVLMPIKESRAVLRVPSEGAETGTGREVAVHVGVVAQVFVGEAARGDLASGVELARVIDIRRVDVRPPGLRVADEVRPGYFASMRWKRSKP